MRDQFAGDITDWLKFSLLRALAGDDRSLGIVWYYIEDRLIADQKKLDPDVAEGLARLQERSVFALEKLNFWKSDTKFYRKHVPHNCDRASWTEEMKDFFVSSDIVFFDPDKGLGESKVEYATVDEIRSMRRERRTLVLIHFPSFAESWEQAVSAHHALISNATDAKNIFTIATSATVQRQNPFRNGVKIQRSRWFTVIDADKVIRGRAENFVKKLNSIEGCSSLIFAEVRND
jgi:hypothetical protein